MIEYFASVIAAGLFPISTCTGTQEGLGRLVEGTRAPHG